MSVRLGFRSITGKLLAAFLLVFLLLAALQYFTCRERNRDQRKLARESLRVEVKTADSVIGSTFDYSVARLKMALEFLKDDYSPKSVDRVLQLLVSEDQEFIAAGLINEKGQVIRRYPALPPGEKLALLPPASLRSIPTISSVSRLSGQPVFVISIPAPTSDNHLNILYVVLPTDVVTRVLRSAVDDSRCVVVLDRDGGTVAQTGNSMDRIRIHKMLFRPGVTNGQVFQLDEPNIQGYGTVSERLGWRIAVFEERDDDRITADRFDMLLWWLLTAVLALLIFFVIGNRIVSPIRKISRAAAAVAVGDMRRRVVINTNDELQSLAADFNKMADSLESQKRALYFTMRIQQSLLDVAKTVSASLDIKRVASSIEDALIHQFGAEHVIIYRVDGGSSVMESILMPEDEDKAFHEAMFWLAQHALDSPGDGAAAYSCVEAGDLPAVTVPLVVGSRPVGVLITTFPDDDYSDMQLEDRISFISAFASCAAIAVHNAVTYGRTEDLIETLDSLRKVDEAISASLDLRQVLSALVQTTEEVMQARACAILLSNFSHEPTVAESDNLSKKDRKKLELEIKDWSDWSAVMEVSPDILYDNGRVREKAESKENLITRIYAPLTAGENVIGAIVVWKDIVGKTEQKSIDLLSAIASHAAVVIANAKTFSREYRIAETLQNTLIGVIPDRLGGLMLGNKYLSALDEARVGGDLFDAIALPNGKIALMIADVSGKGIQAAMHTAMIRYMARAFIFQWSESPAAALNMLNRAIVSYFGNVAIVTVFCAIIDPDTGLVLYANAGHPPAILLTHSGKQQIMLYRTGIPIGYSVDSLYVERSVVLSPGDLLLLYTDGIIEARREGTILSIEGLQEILFRYSGLSPKDMVEMVCEETRKFADGDLRDDIAIIAAALEPEQAAEEQPEIDHQYIHN